MARVISNILPRMVMNLRSVPRLNDKFHVAATQFTPFFRIIEEDKDCMRLQELLNEGTEFQIILLRFPDIENLT